MANKYSRQREAIKGCLSDRGDHPTADMVYVEVRKEYPNISLGTVYRNLTLLAEQKEISRVNVGDGVDHFDPRTDPHMHFQCSTCGCVQDMDLPKDNSLYDSVAESFDGEITGSVIYFYGKCSECCEGERA